MNKLDQLSELRSRLDVLTDDRLAECAAVLAAVKPQLDAINARWEPELTAAHDRVCAMENSIRMDVLAAGEAMKGEHLIAEPNLIWQSVTIRSVS